MDSYTDSKTYMSWDIPLNHTTRTFDSVKGNVGLQMQITNRILATLEMQSGIFVLNIKVCYWNKAHS